MLLKLQWFDIFQKNNACYFELNKLPHEGHGRPHTKQKASAGRCVYCHFTVPMSAVQRRRESMFICTAHSCWQWWPFKKSLSQKLTMPFRKKKKSLTVAAVLLKPAVWHSYDESEEDRNQEHLPPDLLHLSSNSKSLSGWDTLALRPTLIWFGLTCPNNTDDDVPIAFYLH